MHRANVIMFGAGLLLAASAPAFAEGEGDAAGSAATTTETTGTAGGGAAATTGDNSMTATTDGAMDAAWPQAMIDRPYVREKGKLAAYGDFDIAHLSVAGVSLTGEALHLGAAYTVAPKIGVGADYAFPVAGDVANKGKGPLTIFVNYGLVDSAKLHVAVNADFVADLGGSDGMGGTHVDKSINVGLGLKYLVAPKIAIFTGMPFGPGPVGQHLTISLESGGPGTFDIPVGIGLQATPQLFAYVQPLLASIFVKGKPDGADAAAFYFSDALGAPTNIGAWFAVNKSIDVGANITDDLKHAGDFYAIALGARWYN
jgi:hypothetical protein